MLGEETATPEDRSAAAPSRWRRRFLEFAAFLALFAGLQYWQSRDMAAGAMPAVAGTLADGRPASLAAALAQAGGGPLLVYVWSSWCPICRIEEGAVESLAPDWPVLSIAMQSGDAAAVARFIAGRGIVYPALIDEQGEMAHRLGVRGVPAWFVVDGRGRVRFSGTGYTTSWGLQLRLWWAKVAAT